MIFCKEFKTEAIQEKLDFIPGVKKLIVDLHASGIPMAIATNGSQVQIKYFTRNLGDFFKPGKYFSHLVYGADDVEVKYQKPDPDIYRVCASRFSCAPKQMENVLVFEDTLKGVKGASDAGMITVWIVDQRFHAFKNQDRKCANLVIKSFQEFKPQQFAFNF